MPPGDKTISNSNNIIAIFPLYFLVSYRIPNMHHVVHNKATYERQQNHHGRQLSILHVTTILRPIKSQLQFLSRSE